MLRLHLQELLDTYPMLRLITGVAIFAQRPLIELMRAKNRDYLLQIKANLGDTLDALEHCFAQADERMPAAETIEKGISRKTRWMLDNDEYIQEVLDLSDCQIALRVDIVSYVLRNSTAQLLALQVSWLNLSN